MLNKFCDITTKTLEVSIELNNDATTNKTIDDAILAFSSETTNNSDGWASCFDVSATK